MTIGGVPGAARNVISGNGGAGVRLDAAEKVVIRGNSIGLGADGQLALGNDVGVLIRGIGSRGNTVLGNVISGNRGDGVRIEGRLGEQGPGQPHRHRCGRRAGPGERRQRRRHRRCLGQRHRRHGPGRRPQRHLGQRRQGILIEAGAAGNVVLGNFIGIAVDGATPLGNLANGVLIQGSGSRDNTVLGNVISANQGDGVRIAAAPRRTGSGATPSAPMRPACRPGGTPAAASPSPGLRQLIGDANPAVGRNVISANNAQGILLAAGATGNVVLGNFIGLAGTGPRPWRTWRMACSSTAPPTT